jgi:hypothetical protein
MLSFQRGQAIIDYLPINLYQPEFVLWILELNLPLQLQL